MSQFPAADAELAGLGLEVRWVSRAEAIENHVLRQRQTPGHKLAPKSVIEVVVNR